MRILEGVGTLIQLAGLTARLCKMVGLPLVLHKRLLIILHLAYEARASEGLKESTYTATHLSCP